MEIIDVNTLVYGPVRYYRRGSYEACAICRRGVWFATVAWRRGCVPANAKRVQERSFGTSVLAYLRLERLEQCDAFEQACEKASALLLEVEREDALAGMSQ